ncbi:hypothetical protein EV130_101818 [Rhizobium azibense]|uniref:Uncharacterized protein n=1 Tax=Rhizobium azibense TaxID=1136135 RepID=A0A4R3R919_9HYPH|nr:hypothetical protein EV130_101818 [Rhizobium azibense]TCU40749.1 hypothetical protein EV129_10134 [Rhizobium azibense]
MRIQPADSKPTRHHKDAVLRCPEAERGLGWELKL